MKVGAEVHFLSGQVFMLGVAAIAILPRVPSDITHNSSIGGRLSLPFRRALVWLIGIGIVRTLACHLITVDQSVGELNTDSSKIASILAIVDATLATIQITGQSFLCLTTAYIMQCQMEGIINIEGGSPGRSLIPYLLTVMVLAVSGTLLSAFLNPYFFCLVNLGEAISVKPVVDTLRTYASISTISTDDDSDRRDHRLYRNNQGPVLVQALLIVEYWFLTTSIFSCISELIDMSAPTAINDRSQSMAITIFRILLDAIRTNQDNGIDDWTRLLLHSVFLNSVDELMHFSGGFSSSMHGDASTSDRPHEYDQESNSTSIVSAPINTKLRQRH